MAKVSDNNNARALAAPNMLTLALYAQSYDVVLKQPRLRRNCVYSSVLLFVIVTRCFYTLIITWTVKASDCRCRADNYVIMSFKAGHVVALERGEKGRF